MSICCFYMRILLLYACYLEPCIVKVILVLEIARTIILPVDEELIYQLLTNEIWPAQLYNHNTFNQLCPGPSEQKTERSQLATMNFI